MAYIEISKEDSDYVLLKTEKILNSIENNVNNPEFVFNQSYRCIEWLQRWFMPVINLDKEKEKNDNQ